MHEEALEAIDSALALKPDNVDYYIGQRERFMSAEPGRFDHHIP
jgi:hypothetical protein